MSGQGVERATNHLSDRLQPVGATGNGIDGVDNAAYTLLLAATFGLWVHRRVETFEFPEADTIRRRMSVDFTLPSTSSVNEEQVIAVPLTILKKGYLRNFDLTDENGVSLNVLTTAQNADVVVAGFEAFLTSVRKPGDALAAALRGVVGEHDAELAGERLASALDGELGNALGEITRAQGSEVLRLLLGELAGGYMLLVPLHERPERRRLLKFTYDAPLQLAPMRLRDRAYRLITGASSGLGWSARIEDFEELPVGWAQSYHVEVAAPEDTWVAEAVLEEEGGEAVEMDRESSPRLLRPHLHVAGCRRDQTAQLTLSLYARRDALVVPLLFAAAAITSVLAYIPQHGSDLDGQTLGALLLVPFALSAFYVRPSEHSYVTRGIRGMRVIALVPVVAGVLALALIGLGLVGGAVNDHAAIEAARWAARSSAAAAYLLLIAFLAPSLAGGTRSARRWLQRGVRHRCAPVRLIAFTAIGFAWLALFGIVGFMLYSVFPS